MRIITDEPAETVTKHRRSVPPNVAAAAAVAKSLEKLPADRFETARTFALALGDSSYTSARNVGAAPFEVTVRPGQSVRTTPVTLSAEPWGSGRMQLATSVLRASLCISACTSGDAQPATEALRAE